MEKIFILGSSGHARVLIDCVEKGSEYTIAGLIDNARQSGESELGYPVVGSESDLAELADRYGVSGVLIAIGDNYVRSLVAARLAEGFPNLKPVTAIHPTATVAKNATIEPGTVLLAQVAIGTGSTVGKHCIVNTGASLDHDSVMADFSSLAPGCATGGNCHIGAFAAIGIGASIMHNTAIGEHTVIGAGATVVDNIEPYGVALGTPAKVVRSRAAGEQYL